MAAKTPVDLELAPHPARGTARNLGAVAAVFALAGVAQWFLMGDPPIAAAAVATFVGAYGWRIAVNGRAAQANNKAVNLLGIGRLDDAEAILERYAATIRRAGYARALDYQRATIAYRRGDLARTLELCDQAVARPRSWLVRVYDDAHRNATIGLRAIARAATGDAEGTRSDVATLRERDDVDVDPLASAALAEAILLDRTGAAADLREHLGRWRTLLHGWLRPRERALIRALEKKLARERTTIYRTAATRDEPAGQEPALADWLEAIAPGTGAFAARAPGAGTAATSGLASRVDVYAGIDAGAFEAAKRGVAKRRGSVVGRAVVLWVLLTLMFLGIWQILSSEPPDPPLPGAEPKSPVFSTWWLMAIPVVLVVVVFGRIARLVVRARRSRRELQRALRAVALDEPGGSERVAAVAANGPPVIAASAAHAVFDLADKRGDFEGALAAAEAGLAKLSTPALEVATSDWVLPNLRADRAFAKLVLGQRDAALAEMALLAERFPSFPFLARMNFRVQLVDRLRCGDIAAAADVAASAQDLPITPREELLADVARAIADPATPEVERTRIEVELRGDEPIARWIRLVAPGLLDAFARAGESSEGERGDAAFEHAASEEAEAEAEAEAAAVVRPRARHDA